MKHQPLILLPVCLAVWTTTAGASGNGSPVTAATPLNFAAIVSSARASAKANDLDGAEASLTAINVCAKNTAGWHVETSQKLMELASGLAREGRNDATVDAIADRCLQHLTSAAALAADNHSKAQAKAAAAVIYLKFKGDPISAIAYYQAAAQLDPDDKGVQLALARLQSADAKLRSRIHPAKK